MADARMSDNQLQGSSEIVRALAPDMALPVALSDSWERCVSHGLRRQDRVLFNNSVSVALAKRVEEENHWLMTHAKPEMLRLYKSLGSANWLVLCVNATGQIVCFAGDRPSAPRELQVLMQTGRLLVEAELGTTAPGCALEGRRPVMVNRGEHYLTELAQFFCASAPIVGPDGRIAGVLDITGLDVRALPLASDMVSFAVRQIENSMVAAMRNRMLVRFHCDQRLLGTPFEAILGVDSRSMITGANRAACQMLSLSEEGMVGMPLDQLFDDGLEPALRRASSAADEPIHVRSRMGIACFLTVEARQQSASSPVGRSTHSRREAPQGESFIIEDEVLKANYEKAVRIVRGGLPVILQGETGTGKEVFARALHRAARPNSPFLAINCAAIPEGLIEAELFGYADGAFTGGRKGGAAGKIEQADGGVLFLDEIGDMPSALQSRLLRVLQGRTVTRVGESREIPIDFLLVCATHRNLQRLVTEGTFREDLYYRLHGHTLRLPPLRERSDITAVIQGLFKRWTVGDDADTSALDLLAQITPAALQCLARYSWPGNIRQLEQAIRALLALRSPDKPLDVDDLPEEISEHRVATTQRSIASPDAGRILEIAQIDAIRSALHKHRGNVSLAAKALGISRGTLYSKLKRLGIRHERVARDC